MKNKWTAVFPFLLTLLTLYPVTASAAESITQEYRFITTDKDNPSVYIPPEIEQAGKIYRLSENSIHYTVAEESKDTTTETLTESRHYDYLQDKSVPQEITIEKDGNKIALQLSGVEYQPMTFESGRTITVTGTTDFGYSLAAPTAPQTKAVTVNQNGSSRTVQASLVNVVQTEEYAWKDGYTIQGRYYGDADCKYYQFGDSRIPNTQDGSVPFLGYEDAILSSLGLSGTDCRIIGAAWEGEPTTENGVTVRNAVFTCSRYAARYVAHYAAVVPEQISGFSADASYSVELKTTTGDKKYHMAASAEYVEKTNSVAPLMIITAGILVLILFAVGLLFLIKRRRKQEHQ